MWFNSAKLVTMRVKLSLNNSVWLCWPSTVIYKLLHNVTHFYYIHFNIFPSSLGHLYARHVLSCTCNSSQNWRNLRDDKGLVRTSTYWSIVKMCRPISLLLRTFFLKKKMSNSIFFVLACKTISWERAKLCLDIAENNKSCEGKP